MWVVRTKVIPVVLGALGSLPVIIFLWDRPIWGITEQVITEDLL